MISLLMISLSAECEDHTIEISIEFAKGRCARSSEAIFGPGVPRLPNSFRFSRSDDFKVECKSILVALLRTAATTRAIYREA
jgi:hypothetical protein